MIKLLFVFFRVGVDGKVGEGEAVEADENVFMGMDWEASEGEAAEAGESMCVGMNWEVGEGEAEEGKAAWPRMRNEKGFRDILGIKNRI